jgi:hypothetical protein
MFLPNSVGFIAAYWWTSDVVMVSVITETSFPDVLVWSSPARSGGLQHALAGKKSHRAASFGQSHVYSRQRVNTKASAIAAHLEREGQALYSNARAGDSRAGIVTALGEVALALEQQWIDCCSGPGAKPMIDILVTVAEVSRTTTVSRLGGRSEVDCCLDRGC